MGDAQTPEQKYVLTDKKGHLIGFYGEDTNAGAIPEGAKPITHELWLEWLTAGTATKRFSGGQLVDVPPEPELERRAVSVHPLALRNALRGLPAPVGTGTLLAYCRAYVNGLDDDGAMADEFAAMPVARRENLTSYGVPESMVDEVMAKAAALPDSLAKYEFVQPE